MESISPTKPRSTIFSSPLWSTTIWGARLRAFMSKLSLPDMPTPLPPWTPMLETISVLIFPTRTIFTISMVSWSVTRSPSINLGSLPSLLMEREISGPPPWVTMGCMPTYFKSTVSRAVDVLASASIMAWPPYFIMIFFLWNFLM